MPALKALFVVVIQLLVVNAIAPGKTVNERMIALHRWDSHWYSDIANRGYVSTIPPVPRGEESNVTHFPAYPLLIRAVAKTSGTEGKAPALIAAWLMAWLSWFYVFALFRRWQTPRWWQTSAVLLMTSFPSAFFMVAAYSESLFIAAILGFVYWTGRPGIRAYILAALHGSIATATRIAGIVLALTIPRHWKNAKDWALNGFTLSGTLLFFAYCHHKFGMWNIYMVRHQMGWGNQTKVAALLSPSSYAPHFTNWLDYNHFGKGMNAVFFVLFLAMGATLLRWFLLKKPLEHFDGLRLMGIGAALFALLIVTMSSTGFHLVARYDFPIWFLGVMGFTALFQSHRPWPGCKRAVALTILTLVAGAMIWLQCHFMHIYTQGGFVL